MKTLHEPTIEQINDPLWRAGRMLEEIDRHVSELTNNGTREISELFVRNDEAHRVKTYLKQCNIISSYINNTKAIGAQVTFKINANKAISFQELRDYAIKLTTKL